MSLPKQQVGESDEAFAIRLEEAKVRAHDRHLKWISKPGNRERAYASQRRWLDQPGIRTAESRSANSRNRQRRLAEIEACGNPTECQSCGGPFVPYKGNPDGRIVDHRHDTEEIRGIVCFRCNRDLHVHDQRWSEPDRYQRLQAFSVRGAPVTPLPIRSPKKRKIRRPDPGLFDDPPEAK